MLTRLLPYAVAYLYGVLTYMPAYDIPSFMVPRRVGRIDIDFSDKIADIVIDGDQFDYDPTCLAAYTGKTLSPQLCELPMRCKYVRVVTIDVGGDYEPINVCYAQNNKLRYQKKFQLYSASNIDLVIETNDTTRFYPIDPYVAENARKYFLCSSDRSNFNRYDSKPIPPNPAGYSYCRIINRPIMDKLLAHKTRGFTIDGNQLCESNRYAFWEEYFINAVFKHGNAFIWKDGETNQFTYNGAYRDIVGLTNSDEAENDFRITYNYTCDIPFGTEINWNITSNRFYEPVCVIPGCNRLYTLPDTLAPYRCPHDLDIVFDDSNVSMNHTCITLDDGILRHRTSHWYESVIDFFSGGLLLKLLRFFGVNVDALEALNPGPKLIDFINFFVDGFSDGFDTFFPKLVIYLFRMMIIAISSVLTLTFRLLAAVDLLIPVLVGLMLFLIFYYNTNNLIISSIIATACSVLITAITTDHTSPSYSDPASIFDNNFITTLERRANKSNIY